MTKQKNKLKLKLQLTEFQQQCHLAYKMRGVMNWPPTLMLFLTYIMASPRFVTSRAKPLYSCICEIYFETCIINDTHVAQNNICTAPVGRDNSVHCLVSYIVVLTENSLIRLYLLTSMTLYKTLKMLNANLSFCHNANTYIISFFQVSLKIMSMSS